MTMVCDTLYSIPNDNVRREEVLSKLWFPDATALVLGNYQLATQDSTEIHHQLRDLVVRLAVGKRDINKLRGSLRLPSQTRAIPASGRYLSSVDVCRWHLDGGWGHDEFIVWSNIAPTEVALWHPKIPYYQFGGWCSNCDAEDEISKAPKLKFNPGDIIYINNHRVVHRSPQSWEGDRWFARFTWNEEPAERYI